MSSSTSSSSSSIAQRRPLHERSNSEKNKLAIRIVPYSPPRLASGSGSSHAREAVHGTDDARPTNELAAASSPGRKASFSRDGFYAANPGSALSLPTTSTTSLVRAKGKGVSGTKPGSDSSGAGPSTPPPPGLTRASYGSNISLVNAPSRPASQHDGDPASPTRNLPRARRDREISLHSDKTFSIVLKPTRDSDRIRTSWRSPPLSNNSTISSHDRISFDALSGDLPSSPPSSRAESSVSHYAPAPASSKDLAEDHTSSSPWNYHMVGGVRKVPTTPDLKQKGKAVDLVDSSPLPALYEAQSSPPLPSPLAAKQSFNSESSEQTHSTIEQTTNYKVTGRSSPPLLDSDSIELPPSSSHSNYQLFGDSSPAQHFVPSSEQGFVDTPGSKNFITHGDVSDTPSSKNFITYGDASRSSSLVSVSRRPRPQPSVESLTLRGKYSQESLLVPPLHTSRRKSFGIYTKISRESLRGRANSFSSISSVISQEAASIFFANTPNIIRIGSTPPPPSIPSSSWAGPSKTVVTRPRMEDHPHVWSSQLSTVPSESEASPRNSRALSQGSFPDYRSSGSGYYGSRTNSRQMMSISSSLAAADDISTSARSSFDRPGPAYMRGAREPHTPPSRLVRDVDEDGDGLADLHQLHSKSSRPRLAPRSSNRSLNSKSSDRNLHSSASSRAGSFTAASIPAWARVYYGSGERRWLAAAPSIRSYADDSRPGSSWEGGSNSPTNDHFPIFSPRRRPREVHPAERPDSMEITPAHMGSIRRGVRKMTSSIWSPHLEHDRRAARYSMWQPPSMTWSTEGGLGRRNIQVLLFSLGFVLPFAWMIAAILPLPPKPKFEMLERGHSTTMFGIPEEPEPMPRQARPVDDSRFQSARWWRNLNRFMSIIGLLIIGAVIALVILGLRQKWMVR